MLWSAGLEPARFRGGRFTGTCSNYFTAFLTASAVSSAASFDQCLRVLGGLLGRLRGVVGGLLRPVLRVVGGLLGRLRGVVGGLLESSPSCRRQPSGRRRQTRDRQEPGRQRRTARCRIIFMVESRVRAEPVESVLHPSCHRGSGATGLLGSAGIPVRPPHHEAPEVNEASFILTDGACARRPRKAQVLPKYRSPPMARMLLSHDAMRTAKSPGLTMDARRALPAHVPEKGLETRPRWLPSPPPSTRSRPRRRDLGGRKCRARQRRRTRGNRTGPGTRRHEPPGQPGWTRRHVRVRRIDYPGAPSHFVAVQEQGRARIPSLCGGGVANWGVTPRQAEVLGLLALGQANKTIASALGCAGGTVEIHVTDLLRKSGCQSRCELVSRFWSRPIAPVPQERSGRGARS